MPKLFIKTFFSLKKFEAAAKLQSIPKKKGNESYLEKDG
jgi:hypothetical protein